MFVKEGGKKSDVSRESGIRNQEIRMERRKKTSQDAVGDGRANDEETNGASEKGVRKRGSGNQTWHQMWGTAYEKLPRASPKMS